MIQSALLNPTRSSKRPPTKKPMPTGDELIRPGGVRRPASDLRQQRSNVASSVLVVGTSTADAWVLSRRSQANDQANRTSSPRLRLADLRRWCFWQRRGPCSLFGSGCRRQLREGLARPEAGQTASDGPHWRDGHVGATGKCRGGAGRGIAVRAPNCKRSRDISPLRTRR